MTTIRVLLVDDHDVIRRGLRLLLETQEDMQVVGESENGHCSVEEAKTLRPDVILMDMAMPQSNGLEATWQITRAVPSAKVLILSSYSDEHFVEQAIAAGAMGYLMKEAAASEVCEAIREVHNGGACFSPLVSRGLLHLWLNRDLRRAPKTLSGLSSREREVLQLIAEGYASKQIAGLLSLATKTIEKHRQSVMDGLDLHNIATLTRYAVTHGVVALKDTNFYTPNWPDAESPFGRWVGADGAPGL